MERGFEPCQAGPGPSRACARPRRSRPTRAHAPRWSGDHAAHGARIARALGRAAGMFRESARAGDAVPRLVPGVAPLPADAFEVYWPPFAISLLLWMVSAWLYQVYEGRSRSPWFELGRVTWALGRVAPRGGRVLRHRLGAARRDPLLHSRGTQGDGQERATRALLRGRRHE